MQEDRNPAHGEEPPEPPEPLDTREVARVRRRDHDLDAERRDLMRPGMGKVFKQILHHQAREVAAPLRDRHRAKGRRRGRRRRHDGGGRRGPPYLC